jgi:hypothetical protein
VLVYPGGSGQVIEIREILVPARGAFVLLEVFRTDDGNRYSVEVNGSSACVAVLELDSGDVCLDLDAKRREAHAENVARFGKEFKSGAGFGTEPERIERGQKAMGVVGGHGDPDVQIHGGSRVTVAPHGIPAHQQVLNPVLVE